MKRSTLYVVNGIAMLVVFLLCRVLLMPYTYYLYGKQIGEMAVCSSKDFDLLFMFSSKEFRWKKEAAFL